MGKCEEDNQKYNKCITIWFENEYIQGKVIGPMIPCEEELKVLHNCIGKSKKFTKYLENLELFKEQVNNPFP
jgi:Uncharacterised protein family (UPF0203)